jgi:hypothetical protein
MAFLISQSGSSARVVQNNLVATRRIPHQVSDRSSVDFRSSSSYGKIAVSTTVSSASSFYRAIVMPVITNRYEPDPEIAAMSDEELLAEVKLLFGAWADRDDLDDNWRDEIWEGWDLSQIAEDDQSGSPLPA